MPAALRKPLSLLALIAFGQMAVLLIALGSAALSAIHLFTVLLVSAALTAVWDYLVHRPTRQGLHRLQHRLRTLSARAPGHHGAATPHHDRDTSALDELLVAKQKRIAGITRRLRRELERYRAIYKHSHDAVLIFDPADGRLVDCNPRAQQLLGMDDAALDDVRLTDLHDEDESYLRSLIDDVMDSAHGRSIRINYRTASDRVIPADLIRISHDLTPGSRLAVIPEAGHSAYFERPHAWNEAVRGFIDAVEADAGERWTAQPAG